MSAKEVHDRVHELGRQITNDYAENPPLLGLRVEGRHQLHVDLMRTIELPVEVDFMAVSSYGAATKTSGVVRIVKDLDVDLLNREVLIVEDVVDSGLTLNYLRHYLGARSPKSLEVCTLLLKRANSASNSRSSTWASRFPRTSSWATGSTSTSATATSTRSTPSPARPKRGRSRAGESTRARTTRGHW